MNTKIIFKAVSEVLKISEEQILDKNRQYLNEMARTIVSFYLYSWDYTFQQIADVFEMHHATIIHHCKKYNNEYQNNLLFKFITDNVSKYLKFEYHNTIDDLTAIIDYLLEQSKYLEYKTEAQVKLIAFAIYKRCGYSTASPTKSALSFFYLTETDEKFIDGIYNEIKEYVDAQGLSKIK